MVVVDHEPRDWFLLQDEHGLVLDVNCTRSFVSFSVVVRLTAEEAELVVAQGRKAVADLAQSVQYSPERFAQRSGSKALEDASHAAITGWQAAQPAA